MTDEEDKAAGAIESVDEAPDDAVVTSDKDISWSKTATTFCLTNIMPILMTFIVGFGF